MVPTHVPVMLKEVMEALKLAPGKTYVDGTLGLAGHALAAAERVRPGGLVVGLDWDRDLLKIATEKLEAVEGISARTFHADYRDLPGKLEEAAIALGFQSTADGILLDFGVNNAHLELADRGFSIREDGPLDMRMDRTKGETAASFLNRATVTELENTIFQLSDERWARRIAHEIVSQRPLSKTSDLVNCVLAAIPPAKRDKGIHPATRTFQAIRIRVNGELDDLEGAVSEIAGCLSMNGVLAILSYHSGEDRAVKTAFRKLASTGAYQEFYRKPLLPSEAEVSVNPKSRSAKLRALERIQLI